MQNLPNLLTAPENEPPESDFEDTPFWAQSVTKRSIGAIAAAGAGCLTAMATIPPNSHWTAYVLPVLAFVYVCYSEAATIANRKALGNLAKKTVPTVEKVEEHVLPLVEGEVKQ